MALTVSRIVENQKIILWTHLRRGRNSKGGKFSLVIPDARLEFMRNTFGWESWVMVYFKDPFSGEDTKVKRKIASVVIVDPKQDDYGLFGFEGFVKRRKRPKAKEKVKLARRRVEEDLYEGPEDVVGQEGVDLRVDAPRLVRAPLFGRPATMAEPVYREGLQPPPPPVRYKALNPELAAAPAFEDNHWATEGDDRKFLELVEKIVNEKQIAVNGTLL